MEYFVPPVLFALVLRFAFPALVTWFFERFVEPKTEIARRTSNQTKISSEDVTNPQKIETTRKELNDLKNRLER